MAPIDFGLNGAPRSLTKPRAANSAEIARRLSWPPLGFLRASALASATRSGRSSMCDLRPPTFMPVASRLRRRAAASLATSVVLSSNSAMTAQYLTHEDRGRGVLGEVQRRGGGDQGDAALLEHVVPGELDHEVAGEPVGALDHDCARPVGQQGLQHRREAGTPADRIGPGDGRVVELADDLDAGRLGVGVDRRSLPLVAVLVRPGIGPARRPQIGDRLDKLIGHNNARFQPHACLLRYSCFRKGNRQQANVKRPQAHACARWLGSTLLVADTPVDVLFQLLVEASVRAYLCRLTQETPFSRQ